MGDGSKNSAKNRAEKSYGFMKTPPKGGTIGNTVNCNVGGCWKLIRSLRNQCERAIGKSNVFFSLSTAPPFSDVELTFKKRLDV
ncbi:hypothetical protein PanWU01x14_209890 [Parasponia andersonii]|uniref:Uncharacterized protein n=1 Tax=Parasponia andersonii TaxID=3476 RepID=A0A2P5BU98_PARAD|nr:hypothetical protein PanWU01x14_209890 [Parasponia andersonii]